jgi:glutamate-1-semialdehyde aminotransferase
MANHSKFAASDVIRRRAQEAIPGGAHTYTKGDDQYPVVAPGFIAKGLGCHVWDPDGNEFIEYGMGLRAVSHGHAFPEVVKAAGKHILLGTNFTHPSPLEVECAEQLLSFVPGAEMAKFTKDGSSATTAAIRLARNGGPSQIFRTLVLQELIRHGILALSFVVSYSHSDADIDQTIDAVDDTLAIYRKALDDGPDAYVVGRPVQPVFRRKA